MVSVVYSQSQILEKEGGRRAVWRGRCGSRMLTATRRRAVFLVENLRASHERMAHLSVCRAAPSDALPRCLPVLMVRCCSGRLLRAPDG